MFRSDESSVRYVVVSPVKDEERYIEHTLRSMGSQTLQPRAWIIVDDGSTDRTPALIEQFARKHDFIHVVRTPAGARRQPGAAVIHAFNRGYEKSLKIGLHWDFIVKLDCDLSFEPDYFERLFREFTADPQLGIASGVYMEKSSGGWRVIDMPWYHAAGASKVIRRQCWEAVGGFVPTRGWDTVDEIRGMAQGWRTRHFPALLMKHWKVEGSGIGSIRTNAMHGEIYYLTGGSFLFFVLKLLHRFKARPFLVCGLAMGWGYFRACLRHTRLVTDDEARCYRQLLKGRITSWLCRDKPGTA